MGNFCGSCFKGNVEPDLLTPDAVSSFRIYEINILITLWFQETKRRQLAQAAERRLQENESRGIKNVESVKRAQLKAMERDNMEETGGSNGPGLRWTQD